MLGVQPPTKLKRRGSWIIRRSKEEGESVRKRDKEDEKLFLKLKRDNNNCADCSAKGAKHASVKPGVLLCLECAGAHLSLGLPIKLIKDLDHADLERTVAMYNGAANSILESAIKLKKPSQTEPFDGRRAFVAAKYVDMAFRGNQTYPHDLTPQVYKDVVKAGYVHMKENNKLWPRLYCVLTTYLSFYRLPTDTLPELVLELRFSSVLPVTTYPGGCRIKIITPSTSNHLVLQADSAADAQEWLSVLQMVCKIVLSEDEKANQATMEDDTEPIAAPLHEELDLDTKKNEETQYDMMTMSGSNLARQRSFTNLILMEGPLLTMSHSKVWKEWRKRWFVLSRDHLRIFKSKQDARSGAKPQTTVRLLQCSVKASDRFEDKKLCFEITTPEQSILVLAENADEMRNWIFTIRQASGRMLAEAMSDASVLGQGELPAEDLGMTSSGELPPHQMQMSPERSPMRSSSSLLIEKQAEVVAAPSGPICEGFLYKRKSPAKSGKRVWVALKVDSLYIYKHQGDATPLEFVNLLTSSVKVVDPVNHCFDVVLPNAAFHLQAENANDLALWMAALRGIIESLLSNFKKSSASSSPARPRAMSASVVPDSRLTRQSQSQSPPTLMTSSADEMSLEDHGSDELVEDDRVLKPQALLDALAESDNDMCADCGEKDPRWVSINLGLYLCIECSGIHRSLGVHISKVRSIELDLWDKDTIQFMLDMGNKKANAIWEHCVPSEFEARRPGPASDRTTREEWTKHKYIKKTFANLAEVARFEATRALLPATAGASNGFVSPRSARSVSQRSIQRTGPVAANPWRPWQGVAKKKKSQYREGYLNQRGKISKAWAKRWFVLKTSVLFYYKVRGDNQPAGVIDLNECSLRKSETAKKANSFEIVSPTRVYVLYADTDVSFKEWIGALNKAVGLGNGLQLDKQSPVAQRTGSLSPTGQNPSSPRRRGSIASSREAWVTAQYRTDSDANLLKSALTGVADSGAVEEADNTPTVSRVRSPSFGHQRIRANSLEPPKPNKTSEPIPNPAETTEKEDAGETKEEDRSPEPIADSACSDQSTNEKENEENPAHGEHA